MRQRLSLLAREERLPGSVLHLCLSLHSARMGWRMESRLGA
jgi:hypothetical protein